MAGMPSGGLQGGARPARPGAAPGTLPGQSIWGLAVAKASAKSAPTTTGQPVCGEVAEWSIAPHSKCGVRVTVPGVRIPPSPPFIPGQNLSRQ